MHRIRRNHVSPTVLALLAVSAITNGQADESVGKFRGSIGYLKPNDKGIGGAPVFAVSTKVGEHVVVGIGYAAATDESWDVGGQRPPDVRIIPFTATYLFDLSDGGGRAKRTPMYAGIGVGAYLVKAATGVTITGNEWGIAGASFDTSSKTLGGAHVLVGTHIGRTGFAELCWSKTAKWDDVDLEFGGLSMSAGITF